MKDYVKMIDKQSMIVKLILAIFLGPIIYGLYRFAKGRMLVGIVWFLTFGLLGIGWLIDIITIIINNKVKILT